MKLISFEGMTQKMVPPRTIEYTYIFQLIGVKYPSYVTQSKKTLMLELALNSTEY